MPTGPELKALYMKRASLKNMDPLFQITGYWAWSGQLKHASSAYIYTFSVGREHDHQLDFPGGGRAFVVRFRR